MIVVIEHLGNGRYRYGPNELEVQVDPDGWWIDDDAPADFHRPTALLAIRWERQKTGRLPERVEVDIDPTGLVPMPRPPTDDVPAMLPAKARRKERQGVSVAELARRSTGGGV